MRGAACTRDGGGARARGTRRERAAAARLAVQRRVEQSVSARPAPARSRRGESGHEPSRNDLLIWKQTAFGTRLHISSTVIRSLKIIITYLRKCDSAD
ncbi:unnamed protein product [Euphydryas editha]|uniref:Uncharacterized protein n=1 Tax=Euphydryas editha TaxID=104508 RepID=A0AAU9U0Q3_EUPED|nr:unnamed protein product [Euphydryas editha]